MKNMYQVSIFMVEKNESARQSEIITFIQTINLLNNNTNPNKEKAFQKHQRKRESAGNKQFFLFPTVITVFYNSKANQSSKPFSTCYQQKIHITLVKYSFIEIL